MPKRRFSFGHAPEPPAKRIRTRGADRLSALSDELLLRTLSFLPISDLTRCQSISQRLRAITGDSQLWKAAYYNRFVRPRASRLRPVRDSATTSSDLSFSSKRSRWLDEEKLVQQGADTNWKRQYKLRHNWARGSCNVSKIEVAEEPPIPHLLVRLNQGVIFTADATAGLRAWSLKKEQRLLASTGLDLKEAGVDITPPTALAVSAQTFEDHIHECVIGFGDGRFSFYRFNERDGCFSHRYGHASSSNGTVSAIAFAWPYILTMTEAQLLSLYKFPEPEGRPPLDVLDPPRLLSSLRSHTAWPPLSLSLRLASEQLVASIAYALPTYLTGWSVGLQELRLTSQGAIIDSRLASAVGQGFQPLHSGSQSSTPSLHGERTLMFGSSEATFAKPTSLSYSHPYLLVSHADNTLTLYLVTSDKSTLSIGSGRRLWGHTSSVSGAHVGGKGKAVSVSSHGNELRVWELEGGLVSSQSRKRLVTGELSVRIRPENSLCAQVSNRSYQVSELGWMRKHDELPNTNGWVGFDEENVVVLQERALGSQALVVYDFS